MRRRGVLVDGVAGSLSGRGRCAGEPELDRDQCEVEQTEGGDRASQRGMVEDRRKLEREPEQ